jgi:hypothetical protein
MPAAASTFAPARTAPEVQSPQVEAQVIQEPAVIEEKPQPIARPQCMEALARANQVRLARAELKRAIGAGRRGVTEIVLECPWEAESMSLIELLGAQRRWGRARSRKLLTSLGLTEMKRLGTLTERQRGILVRALYAKAGVETA